MSLAPLGDDLDSLSLVEETALDYPDDPVFTKEQLDKMNYTMLRRLAAHSESEEVNGRTDRYVLNAFFARQQSLGEYAKD